MSIIPTIMILHMHSGIWVILLCYSSDNCEAFIFAARYWTGLYLLSML